MKECPACKRCFADEIVHCPEDGEATTPSLVGDPVLDGRYQLEQRLGQGGMGVVYRARHIFLKTQHAIKVILPDLVGNDPNLATRFRQEAMAAANVRHPNIIAVTDFGIVRGNMPFLVMEYVQGESLHDILQREKSLSPERALELMSAICGGMAAAHRQNIVHRDLKPLNVMLQEGMPVQESVRILDFGLAKIKSGEILGSFVAAQTSGLMGSPFYMAPEQWSDEEPDARADIYSLGVMLYQMLAGEVPFKGASIPSIMRKHLTEPPAKMSVLGVDIPPEVEAVVRHCLEKDPASRPQTVDDFLIELRGAIVGTGELLNQTIVDFVQNTNPNLGAPSTRDLQQNPGASTSGKLDQAEKLDEASFQHIPEAIEAQKLREQAAILEAKARQSAEMQRQDLDRLVQSGSISASQVTPPEPVDEKPEPVVEKKAASGPIPPPTSFEASDGDLVNFGSTNPDRPAFNTQAITPAEANAAISAAPVPMPVPPVASVAPPAKKSSLVPILAAVAAVLVLLVGGGSYGVYRYLQSRAAVNADPKTQNGGPDTPPNTPPKTEDPPVVYKPDLAAIPGGKFTMGTNDGPFPERPAHSETVAPFSMDKTEVVNGEYAQFVRETGYPAPSHFLNGKPREGQEKFPVVFVNIADAEAFAAWRSKRDGVEYRLPTEFEWEYAARSGDKNFLFPWGNKWEASRALTKEGGATDLVNVGSRPDGQNAWGVMDLIGSVREWTSSKVTFYPNNKDILDEQKAEVMAKASNDRIVRSSSFQAPVRDTRELTSTNRDWFAVTERSAFIGFRLVKNGN